MSTYRVLVVKRLSEKAILPKQATPGSAGYDLYSAEDVIIPARGKAVVKTDIAIAIPSGYYGRIAPRSGLAANHSIDIGGGVIDRDYRGNIQVIMFNHSDYIYEVRVRDRIAQLILEQHGILFVEETSYFMPDTERGDSGFGSTGI